MVDKSDLKDEYIQLMIQARKRNNKVGDLSDLMNSYSQRLDKARRGKGKAAKKLFKKLMRAVAASDLQWDAKLVLIDMLERINTSPSLRDKVIKVESKAMRERAERNRILRANVIEAVTYGFTLDGGESNAFDRAAKQYAEGYGVKVAPSLVRDIYYADGRPKSLATNFIYKVSAENEITALVEYFIANGSADDQAIDKACAIIHEGRRPGAAVDRIKKTWFRNKQHIDNGHIEKAKDRYGLPD